MKRNAFLLGVVLAVVLFGGGCAWSRVKLNSTDLSSRVKLVQPGVTQARDLSSMLGQPPNRIIALKDGRQIYVYNTGDSKTKALDLYIIAISKTNSRTESTYVFVNPDGSVESVNAGALGEVPWEWWAFGK